MNKHFVIGRGSGKTITQIQHMIDNTELLPFQVTLLEQLKEHSGLIDTLIEFVSEVWEVVKTFATNVAEKFIVLLSREDGKTRQALKIYQRTKNKRIKRKKFKQLVWYLIDELAVLCGF